MEKFLKSQINAIWKLLPLKEEENVGLHDYLDGLRIQLIGATRTYEVLENDDNYNKIINIINYMMIDRDMEFERYRRETFKCISIINKILGKEKA